MKGLLLKDFYMLMKYCRVQLLIMLGFICISAWNSSESFFLFYPCILSGMLPITLLSYDERSKWDKYSCTLPYTRAQLVSAKYLIGLFLQLAVLVLSGAARAYALIRSGSLVIGDFLMEMSALAMASCVCASVCLPFMFKMGVEKGRMAYYIALGIAFSLCFAASKLLQEVRIQFDFTFTALYLLCAAMYALSWYMSVRAYRNREM